MFFFFRMYGGRPARAYYSDWTTPNGESFYVITYILYLLVIKLPTNLLLKKNLLTFVMSVVYTIIFLQNHMNNFLWRQKSNSSAFILSYCISQNNHIHARTGNENISAIYTSPKCCFGFILVCNEYPKINFFTSNLCKFQG